MCPKQKRQGALGLMPVLDPSDEACITALALALPCWNPTCSGTDSGASAVDSWLM